MPKRTVIAAIIVLVIVASAFGIVQYVRGLNGNTRQYPAPDNTNGPAEGGALETGGALSTEAGGDIRHLPARDMPETISSYPPSGPETASPPPAAR